MKFDSIIKSFLKESEHSASIGTLLYQLLGDLEPNAKTKSGTRVSDVLKQILEEFNNVIDRAKQNSEQPETLEMLLRKLSLD